MQDIKALTINKTICNVLNRKKINIAIVQQKKCKSYDWKFIEEKIQMIFKHLKRCSTS